MKRKGIRACMLAVAALLIGCLSASSVYAMEYDATRKGSITIRLDDIGTEFSGVAFHCSKVADVVQGTALEWKWEEGLEASAPDIGDLETAEDYQNAAKKLAGAVEKLSIEKSQAVTDAEGKASFPSLEQGIYLVEQKETGNYGVVDPFLVMIPYTDMGGEWVYDIETETKGEKLPTVPEKPENPKSPAKVTKTEQKVKTADTSPVEDMFLLFFLSGGAVIATGCWMYKKTAREE